MYTENERLVCLKLRNYTRIWNAYSQNRRFGQWNYETTIRFRTYIVKMEGWSDQTTKLQQNLEHINWKSKVSESQTMKLQQDLECIYSKLKVAPAKLRNYTRIWNAYSQNWRLGKWNYETTPGFGTYIVKIEGCSSQTTKLQVILERVYWKSKGLEAQTTKLRQDLEGT